MPCAHLFFHRVIVVKVSTCTCLCLEKALCIHLHPTHVIFWKKNGWRSRSDIVSALGKGCLVWGSKKIFFCHAFHPFFSFFKLSFFRSLNDFIIVKVRFFQWTNYWKKIYFTSFHKNDSWHHEILTLRPLTPSLSFWLKLGKAIKKEGGANLRFFDTWLQLNY